MIPRMRGVAAIAVIVAVGPLIVGCGGSNGAKAISKANATAYARAVVLNAADLPGWRRLDTAEPVGGSSFPGPSFARCLGLEPIRYLARSQSVAFQRGRFDVEAGFQRGELDIRAEIIASEAEVAATPSSVARVIAAIRGQRGASCAEQQLRSESHEEGPVLLVFDRASGESFPPPFGSHSFKLKFAGGFGRERSKRRTPVYADVVGFDAGPALVVLIDTGWGSPPLPATEQRVRALLEARAHAAAPVLEGKKPKKPGPILIIK